MNPSFRFNFKNPHANKECLQCYYVNQNDPSERPCILCSRSSLFFLFKEVREEHGIMDRISYRRY